jgi:hypothetical protein
VAAATACRITEPWHFNMKHLVLADACFGNLPTASLLLRHGLECILNMKATRLRFSREVLEGNAKLDPSKDDVRGDQHAEPNRLYAAMHV